MVALSRIAVFAALGGAVAALYARRAAAPGATGETFTGAAVTTARELAQPLLPRGIRLNNPGNIRRSSAKWQGMSAVQIDPEYVTFSSARFGLRALARLLNNYHRQGFKTIRQILIRYAPPAENKTSSYVSHVSQLTLKTPDAVLSFPVDLAGLMAAIVRHENGMQPYSVAEISEAIRLAA